MRPARRGVARLAVLVFALAALPALGAEGEGRVTLQGGWRLTPNDFFFARAESLGITRESRSIGGPTVVGTFGYMATDALEVTIDLFVGFEQLRLSGREPLSSLTYGGAGGVRYHVPLGSLPFADLSAHVGALLGPTLVLETGGGIPEPTEELVSGYMASAGLSARSGTMSIALEYRLLLARGFVPGIGGINGGGSWFGLGVTWWIAAESRPANRGAF
ncbi:MAG TPA: hypothetical protein VK447_15030 [Myxococcaceae bacterium]|nr:hypothetical protein [Myxococcaceae bacterium]